MRTDIFLNKRLNLLWNNYFSDVKKINLVNIYFGKKARYRLGCIRMRVNNSNQNITDIIINGHFKDTRIPVFVLDATIAHELCHYAQGFSSPLPKLSQYPHRGGVIDKELSKRGLIGILESEKKWLNEHWSKYLKYNH